MAGSHGDNALVDHSFAKGVQLLCCRILDGNARLFGKGDDFAHAAAVGSFEDIDAVDRATFFSASATALRPAMTELSRDWFSDTVSLGTCNTSENMSNLVWRMVRRRTTDRKRFSSFHYSIFWKDLHCKRKKFGEKVLPLSVKRISAAAKRSGYRLPLRKAAEKDPATGICGCTKCRAGAVQQRSADAA